jgi:hypothetical protein
MYIASQVLAAFSLFFNVLSRVFKKQSQCLFVNVISNIFGLLSCFFLTAYMGMAGLFLATVRSVVFYFYSKNNWEKQVWLLVLFILLQLGLCILTGFVAGFIWWDFALVFIKSSIFAYGCWQKNITVFRLCSVASCTLTVVYFSLYAGYVNVAAEVLSIILLIVVMIKESVERKKLALQTDTAQNEIPSQEEKPIEDKNK